MYLAPGIDHRFGSLKDSRVGDQPQEREQTWPRQPDAGRPIELCFAAEFESAEWVMDGHAVDFAPMAHVLGEELLAT